MRSGGLDRRSRRADSRRHGDRLAQRAVETVRENDTMPQRETGATQASAKNALTPDAIRRQRHAIETLICETMRHIERTFRCYADSWPDDELGKHNAMVSTLWAELDRLAPSARSCLPESGGGISGKVATAAAAATELTFV